MLVHPQFDPVAFQIGPLAVRWYGLMYLVAFVFVGDIESADERHVRIAHQQLAMITDPKTFQCDGIEHTHLAAIRLERRPEVIR